MRVCYNGHNNGEHAFIIKIVVHVVGGCTMCYQIHVYVLALCIPAQYARSPINTLAECFIHIAIFGTGTTISSMFCMCKYEFVFCGGYHVHDSSRSAWWDEIIYHFWCRHKHVQSVNVFGVGPRGHWCKMHTRHPNRIHFRWMWKWMANRGCFFVNN